LAPMPLQQGDPPWIGRYRLTARLGAGGMGVVYLGQADDGQQVAVKVLRPEYAGDAEFRTRFQREVAAMARVRNRYTVQVLDADPDSATPFLATDFADGPSLSEHVNAQGPLHPEAVVRLAAALAEAIAAIHAAGVTHRDLKPSNVLLTSAGPKVIDFGIAQVADTVSITKTGMAVGSPGYMAPEQVTGHAGQEADIFTWALIVAFAASGQPPYGVGETIGILHRILNENPNISAVPPQLMPLVQAALAKDPGYRPRAVDLLRELSPEAAAGMAPPTAVDRGMAPRTTVDGQARRSVRDDDFEGNTGRTRAISPDPEWTRGMSAGPRRSQRRWRGLVIAAAAVAVLAGTGAALLSNGGSQPQNGPAGGPSSSATNSAPAGAGLATDTPATEPATVQQLPPGQTGKHKHHRNAGDGNGATASSSPSASVSPITTPSTSTSTGPGTGTGSSPTATATATPTTGAGTSG
jgi:serine/threonine protein kinase